MTRAGAGSTQENDYVRIEIASALQRGIAVIPVLVAGATMPSEAALPADLKPLARRQALELRHTRFAADADAIAAALKKTLPHPRRGWVRASVAAAVLIGLVAVAVGVYQLTGTDRVTQQAVEPPAAQQEPPAAGETQRAFTSFEPNTDMPGGDYTSFRLPQADALLCQKLCAEDQRCLAWTYVAPGYQEPSPICWLKNTVPAGTRTDTCCTSGVAYYRRPAN